jgi:hypothetical protein
VAENERLLIQIPDEWRRHCRRQFPQYKLLREWVLLRKVARRGAPKKAPEDRAAVMVAERVAAAKQRLKAGCEIRRQRKAAGGVASDDSEIRLELQAFKYTAAECVAILRTKAVEGAAVFFVAGQLGKKQTSIRSSLRRARLAISSASQEHAE